MDGEHADRAKIEQLAVAIGVRNDIAGLADSGADLDKLRGYLEGKGLRFMLQPGVAGSTEVYRAMGTVTKPGPYVVKWDWTHPKGAARVVTRERVPTNTSVDMNINVYSNGGPAMIGIEAKFTADGLETFNPSAPITKMKSYKWSVAGDGCAPAPEGYSSKETGLPTLPECSELEARL